MIDVAKDVRCRWKLEAYLKPSVLWAGAREILPSVVLFNCPLCSVRRRSAASDVALGWGSNVYRHGASSAHKMPELMGMTLVAQCFAFHVVVILLIALIWS